MSVTWTSGYGINDAEPFVQWGPKGGDHMHSPAETLTFTSESMCGKGSHLPVNFIQSSFSLMDYHFQKGCSLHTNIIYL